MGGLETHIPCLPVLGGRVLRIVVAGAVLGGRVWTGTEFLLSTSGPMRRRVVTSFANIIVADGVISRWRENRVDFPDRVRHHGQRSHVEMSKLLWGLSCLSFRLQLWSFVWLQLLPLCIRPPAKGGWIIYVTVVLSRPLTRVSPVLLRVNHPKWIRHTIYEYSQSSWTTLCKCLRLYWSSAILMHIINDLLSLYSVILINKQYRLFEN